MRSSHRPCYFLHSRRCLISTLSRALRPGRPTTGTRRSELQVFAGACNLSQPHVLTTAVPACSITRWEIIVLLLVSKAVRQQVVAAGRLRRPHSRGMAQQVVRAQIACTAAHPSFHSMRPTWRGPSGRTCRDDLRSEQCYASASANDRCVVTMACKAARSIPRGV